MTYYDCSELLKKKDIHGETPGIFIAEGNRTAGKTTSFSKYMVDRFLECGEQFILLYRNKYDLKDSSAKFFDDIQGLFYPDGVMSEKSVSNGTAVQLFYNDAPCGFAVSLSMSKKIKQCSHMFNQVQNILFDEFQPEDDLYLPDEISKLMSIIVSVARGQGQMQRPVKLFMLSNTASLFNPYFIAFGICDRLKSNTHFLRGDGFVYERVYNPDAVAAVEKNPVLRALGKSCNYTSMLKGNEYLLDSYLLQHKPSTPGQYLFTISYKGGFYGVLKYPEEGVILINNNGDKKAKPIVVMLPKDMDNNYNHIRMYLDTCRSLYWYFLSGCLRFKNQLCREVCFELIKQIKVTSGY